MATLVDWPLPLSPPYQGNQPQNTLTHLTAAREGVLYYTKNFIEIVGELDTQQAVAREWVLPAALFGGFANGYPHGITRGPGGRVWFALSGANRLVQCDPAAGTFTAYAAAVAAPAPFVLPRVVRFAGGSRLDRPWFTAIWVVSAGVYGAVIGQLNPNQRTAMIWRLPIGFYPPEGFWIESATRVWFSTHDRLDRTDFCLCRLDTSTGTLDYWKDPSAVAGPFLGTVQPIMARGVVGHASQGAARDIWFAYDMPVPPYVRVGRFNLATGTFFRYLATQPASPVKLALDGAGAAWIGHGLDNVSRIRQGANCGRARFARQTLKVESQAIRMNAIKASANPIVTQLNPLTRPIAPVPDNCYLHFPFGSPFASSFDISLATATAPRVYFTQPVLNTIGELRP